MTTTSPSSPFTSKSVRATVSSHLESDKPNEVLDVLRRENGKQLTKRILAKFPGGEAVWHLSTRAGMTSLETWDYTKSQGRQGYHFLLAYAVKSVTINADFVREHNTGYFGARNAERALVQQDVAACAKLADVMNRLVAARAALASVEAEYTALTGYGAPFHADDYAFDAQLKEVSHA